MTEVDAHRDTGGATSFAKGSHAKLMQVLHKLDEEISQLIRDTPVTPIPDFDDGISRSTSDVNVDDSNHLDRVERAGDRADAQPPGMGSRNTRHGL